MPASVTSRIGFKVGAHFGTVVASRLGGSRQQITATGDTVNVASRLMEVAARHGAELALSTEILDRAGELSAPYKSGKLSWTAGNADKGTVRLSCRLAVASLTTG